VSPDVAADAAPEARPRAASLSWLALAAIAPAALLLPLLDPRRLLMVRDLAFFHLPLRQALLSLARGGELPEWNRWINGGQPILSNPNYAAFYPPTWLGLLVPVAYSLHLLVLLHAALALWGSWRLLHRLGCEAPAAAVGAASFAGASWYLSLTSTFNFFCAMAWFPWVLGWALRALGAPAGEWSGAALLAGLALALQLLAGEPVAVLISALAVACLAATVAAPWRTRVARSLAIAVLAAALGAVQLVPTLHRLAGGARAVGMDAAVADRWSTPPARLVDLVLPRFWGDSTRDEEGLWLGWGLHDQDFPYVIALYSGLLPTLLALTALVALPIPHRRAWLAAASLGVLLALGRHDPLWEALRRWVPLFGVLRYPEKFIVLTAAVVPLAGALGWQRLLEGAAAGETASARRAVRAAGLFTLVVGLLALSTVLAPHALTRFVDRHGGGALTPARVAHAVAYWRREALLSLLLAAAVTLLLAGLAAGRIRPSRAATAALLLLAVDLVWYGHGLTPTLPRETMLALPPVLVDVRAAGGRTTSAMWLDKRPEFGLRQGPRGFQQLWGRAQRLDPYIATLWDVEYALHADYDLMLTTWGRHALALLQAAWPARASVDRLLGAWDVGSMVLRRDGSELVRELRAGRMPRPFAVLRIPGRLPRFRSVERMGRIVQAADAEASTAVLDFAREDACIGGDAPPPATYAPARLLDTRERQQVEVRYATPLPSFLVAAITYDDGWSGTLENGAPVWLCPTTLGQIGAALPPGGHTLRLRYRDPWVRIGAAVTGTTLLLVALVALRRRRLPVESAP